MDLNKTNYQEQKQELEKNGFQGFVTISDLTKNPALAPSEKGVYMILRESENAPEFMEVGTGGFFKGKDPNVSIRELKNNWVKDTPILYMGKAGGTDSKATLQSRLTQYMKFGQGKNVGHYGGRLIWQLKDSQDFIVCWKSLTNEEPRKYEADLINDFKKEHNEERPFANLQD